MVPTWTISLELGPRGSGSGPSTRTARRADGTSPALRGRPGLLHVRRAPGGLQALSSQQEVLGEESRGPWP